MHICFVCREYPPSLRGGGIASYIKEVAHGLHDAGHQVTVVAASDDTRLSSDEEDGGVRVIRLSGGDFLIPQVEGNSLLKKFRMFYRFYSYRRKIRETILSLKQVDVIEVPEYGAEGYFLRDIGIPVITRLHTPMLLDHEHFSLQPLSKGNLRYYWQGRKELEVIKRSEYVTSCSTSLKEWCVRFLHADEGKIQVIYNPIQAEQWENGLNTKSLAHDGKRHILFVGTVCDWKGCGDLAEACELLANSKDFGDFQLELVGKTGAYADELSARYGGEPWFHLIGKLPREEVMRKYAQADVVCFPSWWENMPMVCIEAMLSGAIVIGSDSGGMSEIIENGKSGFLLPPRSPKAWAEKMQEVCGMSESQKATLRAAAHQRIVSHFDMKAVIPQMVEYVQRVIADFDKHHS